MGGRTCAQGLTHESSNRAAIQSAKSRKFCAKNQQLGPGLPGSRVLACKPLQKGGGSLRPAAAACNSVHATFVPSRWVSPVLLQEFLQRHLFNRSTASDRFWSGEQSRGSSVSVGRHPERSRSSGRTKDLAQTKMQAGPIPGTEARLTCVSVRCLSSYLLFLPVPGTSMPRGSPSEVRRRAARLTRARHP